MNVLSRSVFIPSLPPFFSVIPVTFVFAFIWVLFLLVRFGAVAGAGVQAYFFKVVHSLFFFPLMTVLFPGV